MPAYRSHTFFPSTSPSCGEGEVRAPVAHLRMHLLEHRGRESLARPGDRTGRASVRLIQIVAGAPPLLHLAPQPLRAGPDLAFSDPDNRWRRRARSSRRTTCSSCGGSRRRNARCLPQIHQHRHRDVAPLQIENLAGSVVTMQPDSPATGIGVKCELGSVVLGSLRRHDGGSLTSRLAMRRRASPTKVRRAASWVSFSMC